MESNFEANFKHLLLFEKGNKKSGTENEVLIIYINHILFK